MNFKQIGLIMRLTTVLLMASLIQVSANTLAQRLTMHRDQASLKWVFAEIKKQTGFQVLYQSAQVNAAKPIKISLNDVPLKEAMGQILAGQELDFEIEEKSIIIKRKEPSFLDRAASVIQSVAKNLWQDPVRGVVKDQDGNPLPNASIRVKGKSAVTNTNEKGEFSLSNVADDAVLLVSYVGYKTLEISLKDAVMPLEIKLNMATGELEEVNIQYSTGYQNINIEQAVGSVSVIDNNLLNRKVSTNILERLYEVSSGLNFDPKFNNDALSIRGVSTINASQSPLIVLDNFPYSGDISNINPNDIENITILKDAAAASIWGVQAGNGVIVITSKKGRLNTKLAINFSSNLTIGDRPEISSLPTISSSDYIELEQYLFDKNYYASQESNISKPVLSEGVETMIEKRDGKISTEEFTRRINALKEKDIKKDVDRYLLRSSQNEQYALNLKGGGTNYNYYVSLGLDHNKDNSLGNLYGRKTARLFNTFKPIRNLEIQADLNYTFTNTKNESLNFSSFLPYGTFQMAPYTSLVDQIGNPAAIPNNLRMAYVDTAAFPSLLDWHYRPLEDREFLNSTTRGNSARIRLGLKYNILNELSLNVTYQYQNENEEKKNIQDANLFSTRDLINRFMYLDQSGIVIYPIPLGGIMDLSKSTTTSWNIRGQLDFNKKIGNHRINSILGAEASESIQDGFTNMRSYGYDVNSYTFSNNLNYETTYSTRPFGNRLIQNPYSQNGTLRRYLSFYSNISYSFNEKYSLYTSGRADGSNFFGVDANKRFVPLWSAGISWNLSKETFYKFKPVNDLKFRLSYGYNGNTNNSASSYTTAKYRVGTVFGTTAKSMEIVNPPNPELRWEKVQISNLGIDFKLANHLIDGSVDLYYKNALDLISNITVDATTGVTSYIGNNASIKGKGLDVNINVYPIRNKIKWFSNILFSYTQDRVTKYEVESLPLDYITGNGFGTGNYPMLHKSLNSLFSYQWAGLDAANGDPTGYVNGQVSSFADVSSKSTVDDVVYNGPARPMVFGSFRNTVSWKGISLSVNITYKFKYFFRRNSLNYVNLMSKWGGHNEFVRRWQKQGDELHTNVPSIPNVNSATRDRLYQYSDIMIEKGDHIRLQDVRINYDFKHAFGKTLTKAQLFIYCNNLGILWSANKLKLDPDYEIGGSQFGTLLPLPKSISVGLNINF